MSNRITCFLFLGSLMMGGLLGCDKYEVKEVAGSIFVDKGSLTLFVGEQVELKASPTDETSNYSWMSEDPSVATVGANGLVEAVGEGATNIVVMRGEIKTKVPVSAVVRIPLEDVLLSESALELMPREEKGVFATFVPITANDVGKQVWYSENPSVAIVSEVGEITAVSEGITEIVYQSGDIEKRLVVDVSFTKPFNGPHVLSAAAPAIIYAADFDYGGQGHAFNEANPENPVGNDNYRRGKGDNQSFSVEIEGDGTNIGFINAGEWLQYTVEVEDAGEYLLDFGLSAAGDGQFRVEIDGQNVTGAVPVPNNGSWSDWRFFPGTPMVVNLTEGRHKVRFVIEQSGFNLRGMRFVKK